MCDCWDGDTEKRPEFTTIVKRLTDAHNEIADIEQAVDITKVNNILYKAQKEELRKAMGASIPGSVDEGGEEEGEEESPNI